MPKKSTFLPESVRQTAIASAPLFIVVILFIFVGKFGVSKVLEIRAQIQSANATVAVLTQKLNLLQTLSATASSGAPLAASALPDANPALFVTSQLKTLAEQKGIVLSDIKSTSGVSATNGMNEANISFSASGTMPQIFSFLASTSNLAPVMIVDKISMASSLGSLKVEVGVKSYWASLPTTIPSISAPVTDLTAAEKKTLTSVVNLTQPAFVQAIPSQGGLNPNPFGQ